MKAADLVTYRSEEKSLKERAEQAQTFDETFNNLVMQFKTMALPFIEALNSGLVQPMIKFQEQMKGSEFLENVKNLGARSSLIVCAKLFCTEDAINISKKIKWQQKRKGQSSSRKTKENK